MKKLIIIWSMILSISVRGMHEQNAVHKHKGASRIYIDSIGTDNNCFYVLTSKGKLCFYDKDFTREKEIVSYGDNITAMKIINEDEGMLLAFGNHVKHIALSSEKEDIYYKGDYFSTDQDKDPIKSLDVNESFIVGAGSAGRIRLWDRSTSEMRHMKLPVDIKKVLITDTNIICCGAKNGMVWTYKIKHGAKMSRFRKLKNWKVLSLGQKLFRDMAYDNNYLYVLDVKSNIICYKLAQQKRAYVLNKCIDLKPIQAIFAQSQNVVMAGATGAVTVLNMFTNERTQIRTIHNPIIHMAPTKEGIALCYSDRGVHRIGLLLCQNDTSI